jgi:hypothetical protein
MLTVRISMRESEIGGQFALLAIQSLPQKQVLSAISKRHWQRKESAMTHREFCSGRITTTLEMRSRKGRASGAGETMPDLKAR